MSADRAAVSSIDSKRHTCFDGPLTGGNGNHDD